MKPARSLGALAVVVALTACGGGDGSAGGSGGAGSSAGAGAGLPHFGVGHPATAAEIAALDIDVGPDGVGLPPGSGTAEQGAAVYAERCQSCHGPTGVEPNPLGPVLVGRIAGDSFPFGTDPRARATIGSYWPYATTVFDYVRRAMPFDKPGSLTDQEVYALTAYLLWRNELIGKDDVMDATSLTAVRMPSRDRFVPDDRTGGPGFK